MQQWKFITKFLLQKYPLTLPGRLYHLQHVTKLYVCGLGGNPGKWFKLYLPNSGQSGAVKPNTPHLITLVHIEVTQHGALSSFAHGPVVFIVYVSGLAHTINAA